MIHFEMNDTITCDRIIPHLRPHVRINNVSLLVITTSHTEIELENGMRTRCSIEVSLENFRYEKYCTFDQEIPMLNEKTVDSSDLAVHQKRSGRFYSIRFHSIPFEDLRYKL